MKIITLLLVLTSAVPAYAQQSIVDERTGVEIIFSDDGSIFPGSWYSGQINAKAESLDEQEYARSEEVVKAALAKYPKSLIADNLKAVYVLNRVEFYGQSFGGTNSTDVVYLSNRGIKSGYTNFYLEQLFHAEFSSVLLRKYDKVFNKAAWIEINPNDFNYGSGGVAALRGNKDSEHFDTELNALGFINQYATSSMENDFNAFAKNLFLPKAGFHKLVDNYAPIQKKRKLIIAFYNQLDTSLTREHFDNILNKATEK